jgi:DNA-binding transcriptional MerR regulator
MGAMAQDEVDRVEYDQPRYSIGEAAEKSGLSRDTLRWYERIGLMDYVGRDTGGKRRFSDRDLNWLHLITCLRRTSMSVADMLTYAELVRAGDATTPQRLEMFQQTREDVLGRIDALRQTLTVLDRKIAMYEERTAAMRTAAAVPVAATVLPGN